MEKLNVTADNLNDVLGFDTGAIEVHEDGTVTRTDDYAPELCMEVDEDGQHIHADDSDLHGQATEQGWELLTGWTGQYSYNGPVMHSSEYIGGRLAEYILETPGTYTALVVNTDQLENDDFFAGWAIARKL